MATCNFPLGEEKLVVPLIATPNVDKCNRRQTRKATELAYMLRAEYLCKNECCSFCKQLGQCPSTNYAMSRKKRGFKMGIE
jgi:hypothetical protein